VSSILQCMYETRRKTMFNIQYFHGLWGGIMKLKTLFNSLKLFWGLPQKPYGIYGTFMDSNASQLLDIQLYMDSRTLL